MSLTTAIRDGRAVQWVVEFNGIARSDGSAVTIYYTLGVNYDGGTVKAAARILDISSFGEALPLGEPVRLSGVVKTAQPTVRLDTSPLADGAAGALRSEIESVQWADGLARLYLAPIDETWSSAELQLRTTILGEPEWDDEIYKFELHDPTEILGVPVEIASHVGIPTCWEKITGIVSVSTTTNAAYDVAAYTAAIRFRTAAVGAVSTIVDRQASATDRQFRLLMIADGSLNFKTSSGGVADVDLFSVDTYDDGAWHWAAIAIDPGRHAYLMVDGSVVAESTSPGEPDIPAAGISWGGFVSGFAICDTRFYPSYMSPPEARAEMAARSDDPRAVGMWRADVSGSTMTDYSGTANHATITGTEGVNWDWVSSDLGEPELAGQPYPLLGGLVAHAPTHRVNAALERYRVADITPPEQLDMRQQGDVITAAGWTDKGGGVVEFTSAASQPVTQSRRGNSPSISWPGNIAFRLLSGGENPLGSGTIYPARGGPALSQSSIQRLNNLLPYECGFFADGRPTLRDIADGVLGELGAYLVAGRDGTAEGRAGDEAADWTVDFLLPPVGPGPFGEPCISTSGHFDESIAFGDVGDRSGSYSLACWYLTQRADAQPAAGALGSPGTLPDGQLLMSKGGGLGSGYALTIVLASNAHPGRIMWTDNELSIKELLSKPVVQPGKWGLVVAVYDSTAGTARIYHGVAGASGLRLVASASSVTGTPTTNAQLLKLAGDGSTRGLIGSVQHVRVFDQALTFAERAALFAGTGSLPTAAAYVPGTEGAGAPQETISATSGTLSSGIVWVPEQTLDLRAVATLRMRRTLREARGVRVAYDRNYKLLTDADLAGSVTAAERLILTTEAQWVTPEDPDASSQPDRIWKAPWFGRTGAQIQAQHMLRRVQGEHRLAGVDDYDLRGVSLRVGSEIALTHPEITSGVHWRVITRMINPGENTTALTCWR